MNSISFFKALLMKEIDEELKGGQKKLDVAEPKGKITAADFKALRGKKGVKKEVDTPNPPTDYSGKPAIPGLGPIVGMKEGDHEVGMAKNELRDMISNASKIDQMVGEGDNLPGWVSAYISLAADYMHSVAEYLAGESSRIQKPGPGYGTNSAVVETDITPMFTQLHPKDRTLQQYVDVLKKDPNIAAAIEYESDFKDALKRRIYIHGDKDEIGRTAGIVLQIDKHGDRYSGDNFGRIYKMFKKQEMKEDHEVGMANSSLESIIKSAMELKMKLGNDERNIPGWIQDHITNAENYIDQAAQGFHELSHDDQAGEHDMDELPDGTEEVPAGDEEDDEMTLQGLMESLLGEAKKKPSAGLTKKQKSTIAKKAKAGKDVGKKGKGFEKIASKAAKKYGSKEKGQAVAAAAMWKSAAKKAK